MSNKHTPGPWVYREYGGMCGTNIFVVERPSHEPICTLPDNRYNGFAGEANARLIAAAPELLEALMSILDYAPQMELCMASEYGGESFTYVGFRGYIADAKAAIAKALGEIE